MWGYNGYCRLGLGNQVDILKPKVVPQVNQNMPFILNRCNFSFSLPAQMKRRWEQQLRQVLQIVWSLISKGCTGWLARCYLSKFFSWYLVVLMPIFQWKNSGEGNVVAF